jgi:hypothetical protein
LRVGVLVISMGLFGRLKKYFLTKRVQ